MSLNVLRESEILVIMPGNGGELNSAPKEPESGKRHGTRQMNC